MRLDFALQSRASAEAYACSLLLPVQLFHPAGSQVACSALPTQPYEGPRVVDWLHTLPVCCRDLSFNSLTGSIPYTISGLRKLQYL